MKQSKAPSLDQSVQNSEPQEPFIRRWSKRKLDSAHVPTDDAENTDNAASNANAQLTDAAHVESAEVQRQAQIELTDEDMPPLETLDEHSDFSMFLSPKVSETLRRQALQKLFHFQQFNITDGLNDYDEDYTSFEILGDIIPHDLKRLLQREAEKSSSDKEDTQQNLDKEISSAEELEHIHASDAVTVAEEEPSATNTTDTTETTKEEEGQESSTANSNQQTTNSF